MFQYLFPWRCEEVDRHPALYSNQRLLSEAIRRYEEIWLPLVAKHGPPGVMIQRPPGHGFTVVLMLSQWHEEVCSLARIMLGRQEISQVFVALLTLVLSECQRPQVHIFCIEWEWWESVGIHAILWKMYHLFLCPNIGRAGIPRPHANRRVWPGLSIDCVPKKVVISCERMYLSGPWGCPLIVSYRDCPSSFSRVIDVQIPQKSCNSAWAL